VGVVDGGLYDLENAIDVVEHIVVPEAQHSITVGLENSGTGCIGSRYRSVLATINLHDDAMCVTGEIRNEAGDADLATKMRVGCR
jgi:hypothetical protein